MGEGVLIVNYRAIQERSETEANTGVHGAYRGQNGGYIRKENFSRYGGFRKTSKTEVSVTGQEKTEKYTGLYLAVWSRFYSQAIQAFKKRLKWR